MTKLNEGFLGQVRIFKGVEVIISEEWVYNNYVIYTMIHF